MKGTRDSQSVTARSWLVSFNDLLTVLLAFFILLVAVSTIGVEKVREVSSSAVRSFGTTDPAAPGAALIETAEAIPGVAAQRTAGGVALRLPEALFRSGSAHLVDPETLRGVGKALRGQGGAICVEGHTDALPVGGDRFASNWELSTRRAVNTVRFLIDDCGIDPRRLSAAGYADARPLASNATEAGRAANRRVEIIVSFQ